jgi:N-acetylglucosamine-6-phosphate deacetylase
MKGDVLMKAIINANIVLNDRVISDSALLFDGVIRDIVKYEDYDSDKVEEEIDANKKYVFPGFIDIHIHGFAGYDTMDEIPEAILEISKGLVKTGVTSFLPTTMTMSMDRIENALKNIRKMMNIKTGYAKVRGAHLEGPFISEKFKGAQDSKYIISPNETLIENYADCLKIVTLAPESDGAIALIKKFKGEIVFSIGHTDSSYEGAIRAIDAGASHSTHTFNAMTGLHHRKPGVVGAVLLRDDVNTEFIADQIHTHKDILKLMKKIKTSNHLILITDSMRAGGMQDGEYNLGGQRVFVKNNSARLEDGTLAGSVLTMNKACKNMHDSGDSTLCDIAKMSSYNPARVLKLDDIIGSIEVGKVADLVILNERFEVEKTFIDGNIVYDSDKEEINV